ncbi:hypothetical protein BGZ46_005484 [Entomortierella lignicola]|nr:hypothetical protein BGZ46_005484 [Entomortierella lignicola]
MRLITGILPILSFITVAGLAAAANGDFLYKVGRGTPASLANPKSGQCINLFGATEEDPAFSPEDLTTSTATVFLDFDCNGDVFFVMNPGKKLGDRLKLRSVVFS